MQLSLSKYTWNSVKSIEVSEYEGGRLADPAKNRVQVWNLLLAVLNLRVLFPHH